MDEKKSVAITGITLSGPIETPSLDDNRNDPCAFQGMLETNDFSDDRLVNEQKSARRSVVVWFESIARENLTSASASCS